MESNIEYMAAASDMADARTLPWQPYFCMNTEAVIRWDMAFMSWKMM